MTNQEIQDKRIEQVMRSQGHSVTIEYQLCRIMGINRMAQDGSGLLDIARLHISADDVRKHPYQSMKQGLFYVLANKPSKKEEIENFLDDYAMISEMRMDDILSFATDTWTFNGGEYIIPEENGEIYIEKIIDVFEDIIK